MDDDLVVGEGELLEVYQRGMRALLWRLRPRQLQRGVDRLQGRAGRLIAAGFAPAEAFVEVYRRTARRVIICLARRGPCRVVPQGSAAGPVRRGSAARRMAGLIERQLLRLPVMAGAEFHCDAALGGLARWLRAAGYDARWWPGIEDARLVRKALDSTAILLTTDRPLCDRAAVAYGVIPSLLVPVTLKKLDQFAFVVERLQLPLKAPRCMQCAGRLVAVDKADVRHLIPPRTYPWRDDYFRCDRCGKLYWRGTHWQQIGSRLQSVARLASAGRCATGEAGGLGSAQA